MKSAAATGIAAALLACAGLACAGPVIAPRPSASAGLDGAAAREVLLHFAEALEAGRFEVAWALLSPRWRSLTTPARLATDWRGARGVAGDAARRVRARGATAPLSLQAGAPDVARFDLGEGCEAVLVAEGPGWRVDALE